VFVCVCTGKFINKMQPKSISVNGYISFIKKGQYTYKISEQKMM